MQKEIQRILHLHHPDIAFRGEEDIANTSGEAIRTWLVDPICGTTNFAAYELAYLLTPESEAAV